MKIMTLFAVLVMILAILMSSCKGQTTAQGAGETTDTQEVTAQTTDDTQASETTLSETQTETEAEDTQSSETNPHAETSIDGKESIRFTVVFYDDTKSEFILTKEETETIKKFFYNHEMTIIDSPLDRVGPLMLFLGNDVLSTYYADLSFLDGIIDGRYVVVELSDAECREFQSIIESYVDVTQLP